MERAADEPDPASTAARVHGRRSPVVLLCGAALVLLGAGAVVTASSLPTATARPLRPNLPVNPGATDGADISANNSPTLVRNPEDATNLVVVNRVDSPSFSCGLQRSLDGGATWEPGSIPFPEGEELPPRCFAPDAAFTSDGTLVVSFVTLQGVGNTPNAAWIARSDDGGRTLGTPVRVLGPLAFQVRLTADPVDPERLYLSWLQAGAVGLLKFPDEGNPVMFSRSDDKGSSWTDPRPVNPPSRTRVVAPSLAVGRGGALYVLYLDVGDDRLDYHGGHEGRGGEPFQGRWSLVLARSRDGGKTWRSSPVDDALVPAERFLVFLPPSPSLVVDRAGGRIYAAFHDARLGDADVWLWRSDDGGRSFGAPRRVNDTRRRDATSQYLPRLSLAPDGRLDVAYYDRRADRGNVLNEVSLQSSSDGGRTFGPRVAVSDRAFSSGIGFGAERDLPDLGSRLALVSTDRRALAVWSDTRAGSRASGKQDLAGGVVELSDGSPLRGPLRAAGTGLAGTGLLVLAWWARPRRAATPAPPGPGAAPDEAVEGGEPAVTAPPQAER